jgi:ABC-type phosphate transport system ATPase subunit
MKIKIVSTDGTVLVTDEENRELDNVKSVSVKYNVKKGEAQATIVVVNPLMDIDTDVSTKVVKKK